VVGTEGSGVSNRGGGDVKVLGCTKPCVHVCGVGRWCGVSTVNQMGSKDPTMRPCVWRGGNHARISAQNALGPATHMPNRPRREKTGPGRGARPVVNNEIKKT